MIRENIVKLILETCGNSLMQRCFNLPKPSRGGLRGECQRRDDLDMVGVIYQKCNPGHAAISMKCGQAGDSSWRLGHAREGPQVVKSIPEMYRL